MGFFVPFIWLKSKIGFTSQTLANRNAGVNRLPVKMRFPSFAFHYCVNNATGVAGATANMRRIQVGELRARSVSLS